MRLINYVNDTLYFGSTDEAEEEFVKELRTRLNFNLLETASWYLGMKINYNQLGATIDQQLYAKSIVNKLIKKGTDIFPRNTLLQPDVCLPAIIVRNKYYLRLFLRWRCPVFLLFIFKMAI